MGCIKCIEDVADAVVYVAVVSIDMAAGFGKDNKFT